MNSNNSSKEVRVFISSTFNDLHSERNYLNNVVFPKVRSFCNEHALQFIPIDLRWGISKQEEKSGKVVERCLSEIDESRPYFIGILGQRYGWVPSEEDQVRINISNENKYAYALEQLKEKKSITHLEILHGVLNSPDMYDNSFFLFKNPSAIETVPHDLREELKEKDPLFTDKLRDLKQKIEHCLPSEQISEYDCSFNGFKLDWKQTPEIKMDRSYKDKVIEICGSDNTKKISIEQYEEQTDTLKNVLSKYIEYLPARKMYELASDDLLESMGKIWALSTEEFDSLEHLLEDNHIDIEEFETLSYKQKQLVRHFGYVDFKGFEKVGEWLTESLIAEIRKDRLEGVEPDDLTETVLEIRKHKAFQIEKLDAFVERPGVTKDLETYLNSDSNKPLLFTGKPGSGKSSMMAHLASTLEENEDIDHCLRFIGATKKSNNITSLLVSIIEELEERYEIERPAEYTIGLRRNDSDGMQINFSEVNEEDKTSIDQEPQKLFKYFEYILRAVSSKTKLILILDAINQLSERDDAYLLSWLPYTCHKNIRIICSSLPRKEETEEILSQNSIYESAERRELEALSILPLEAEEKKGIVINILVEKYGKKQESFPLDVLVQKEESNSPLYLYIASEELRSFTRFNEIDVFTTNLPGSTTSIIEHLLTRLELEFGEEMVRDSLSLIVSSLYGLSEFELNEILSNLYGQNYQVHKWQALYHNLRPYLKRGVGNSSLINFMHGQFIELVKKRYLSDKNEQYHYWNILGEFGGKYLFDCFVKPEVIPFNTGNYTFVYYTLTEQDEKLTDIITSVEINNESLYEHILGLYINWLSDHGKPEDFPTFKEVFKNFDIHVGAIFSHKLIQNLKERGFKNQRWKLTIYLELIEYQKRIFRVTDCLDVKFELIQSYHRVGSIYLGTNDLSNSKKYFYLAYEYIMLLNNEYGENVELDLIIVVNGLASVYKKMNRYKTSLKYLLKAEEVLFKINNNRKDDICSIFCTILINISGVYLSLKQYSQAERYALKAEKIQRSISPKNIEDYENDLSSIFDSIGTMYYEMGRFNLCLKYYHESLAILQKLYSDKPEIFELLLINRLNNIGSAYRSMKRYESALKYELKSYEIANKLFREYPENTEDIYRSILLNLSSLCRDAKLYERSEELGMECLKISRKSFAKEEEACADDLTKILNNLGLLYMEINDYKQSLSYLLECVGIQSDLVKKQPEIYEEYLATNYSNISVLYNRLREYNLSIGYQKKAIAIRRYLVSKYPNSNKSDLALSLNNIAVIYLEVQDCNSALIYLEESCLIYTKLARKFPEKYNSIIASIFNNMGRVYRLQKNIKKAIDYQVKAIGIIQVLISENPKVYSITLVSYLNELGVSYGDIENYELEEKCYLDAHEIKKELYDEAPEIYEPQLVVSYNNLATLYAETTRYELSIINYKTAIEIQEKQVVKDSDIYIPNLVQMLYNISSVYEILGQNHNALEYLNKGLMIFRKMAVSGYERYKDLQGTMLNLKGNIHLNNGDYNESAKSYLKSQAIRKLLMEKDFKTNGIYYSQSLNNLGKVNYKLGEYDTSVNFFIESLEIRRKLAQKEPEVYSPHVGDTLYNMGLVYRELLQIDNSVRCLLESYGIRKKLAEKNLNEFADDFVQVNEELYNYYNSLNDIEKANCYKQEAENINKKR